jgi:hypothetical protein
MLGNYMPGQNAEQLGMGGVAMADHGSSHLNYLNPASYGFLRNTTLQLGLFAERYRLNSLNINNVPTGTANFGYLHFGMPTSKNSGLSFGLLPASRVYYNAGSITKLHDTIEIAQAYRGGGGLQKAYIGFGGGYKNFRAGVNANFIFGNIEKQNANIFADSLSIYRTDVNYRGAHTGIEWNTGLQYKANISKKDTLKLGVTYTPEARITNNRLQYTVNYYESGGFSTPKDTLDSLIGKTLIQVPAKYAGGFIWKHGSKIEIGVDYSMQDWTQYRNDNIADSGATDRTIRIGLKYMPMIPGTTNSLLKRLNYTVGFYTGEQNIKVNNHAIKTNAATMGVQIPIKKQRAQSGYLSLSVQTGVRGSSDNGLIRENFTRFNIGANLSELWFQKNKYR